jgi:two-component system, OmpR family, sensor histidine kinase SenX3
VVGAHRRRNLAVGFGILLLLGASVGLVVVSSQRARRLAERQMEFVAAVSHELRTPVSVICSTAENLADGVVSDPTQVRVYGGVLRDEGRRLGQMVEQVLEFAGTMHRGARPHLEELAVGSVVDGALEAFAGPLESAGFTVVKDLPGDLPAVRGDALALRRALQNLIENVLKYGAGGRWLGLRAAAGDGGREVHVTVEDHGQGIAASDLPRLFEPFVRGDAARAAQARGFGLGLALVRRVAEDHGGSVAVDSVPGRGSAFTLRLPAAPPAAPSREATDALPHPSR